MSHQREVLLGLAKVFVSVYVITDSDSRAAMQAILGHVACRIQERAMLPCRS